MKFETADKVPGNFHEPIVYITKNKKIGVLKDTSGYYGGKKETAHSNWDFYREKYGIDLWLYQKVFFDQIENFNS